MANTLAKTQEFQKFLKSHKQNTGISTHTIIGDKMLGIYGGSFTIPDEELPKFYDGYKHTVFVNKIKQYLTEAQLKEENGQMAVDLDFKYSPNIEVRLHTKEHVMNIVLAYLDEFKKIYAFDADSKFDIFVMEKPNINKLPDITKDGIHIIFGLKVDYATQLYIRKQLIPVLSKEIDLPFVNSWESILDEGISKGTTNWQLYGSRKPDHEAYELTQFWNVAFDPKDSEFVMNEFDGKDFCVMDNFELLSVRNTTRPKFEKKSSFLEKHESGTKKGDYKKSAKKPEHPDTDKMMETDEVRSLLFDVIGTEKEIITFEVWWAILGILKYNGFSKDLWMEWNDKIDLTLSKRQPSEKWDGTSGLKPVEVGVLQYLGGKINPDAFQLWKKQFCPDVKSHELSDWYSKENEEWITIKPKKIITEETRSLLNKLKPFKERFTSGLIADVFKVLYHKEFKFCDGKMYHFNNVYWKPDDKALSFLHNFVDKNFVKAMTEYCNLERQQWTTQLADADDEVVQNAKNQICGINRFSGSVLDLRKLKERKEFIADICHRLTDNDAEWNKNPYIFAFENVMFDLKTQQRVTPNPDDFINFTCGYEYDFAYDTSKNTTELQKIIDMILPDKEVQNYDLEILASGMCGIQVQKVFMNNGKGGNGKSLLNGLAMKTMGHYSYDMPSSLLSEKIKLGANPEAAKLDRKRLVFGCEPDANSPLCCAVLKPLTGEPTLGVRECFSNKVGISLNLTLIIACNDKPQLDEVNDAVTRRMKGAVVPFSSKFVSQSTIDELTIENEGVKPANLFLANEFYVGDEFKIIYKQALFHILLARFPDYLKNQLNVVPDIVLRLSRDYMACSDNIYDWFLETYEKDPNEMVFVDDVFSQFSFSQKFLQMTKMEKRKYASVGKFKDKLESNLFIARYYRPKDKYWKQEQIKKPFIEGWKLIPEVTHQQIGQTTTQ